MSIHLQPPVPLVTVVKTEPPTVIKNEPSESPEEALEEEISTDIKYVDIVNHPLSEDLIKSETVLEDIVENKHLESVQTQALVKTENSPFIKTENITQRNKSEGTRDGNVSKGTGQGVVEVQASIEHSNALSKLEIGTTLWEKEKEKIKVIIAPRIHIKSHEYTSLADDKHVCNHCQHSSKSLKLLKSHIKRIHRKDITMYQCPYCPYKSIWSLKKHIIWKHKDPKDIQCFQCNLCEMKFKLKGDLTQHMKKVHLKHKQMQDRLAPRKKRYHCVNCGYQTDENYLLKKHNLVHLKPEEIEYFYCYHCSFKYKQKDGLKTHIFKHHIKNNIKREKRYGCNKCNYETYTSTQLKNHKLTHLKPEEIQYFYCHHCSNKFTRKFNLKIHIFRHFKNEQVEFDCYICNFMTSNRESIIRHIKKHSKVQNKSEINEGS